jgi:hypothetical protein
VAENLDREWFSKDLQRLWQWVSTIPTERIGGKLSHYLPGWRETCGGETFIALGMLCYWKDAAIAEQACREAKKMAQYSFKSAAEKDAFWKLLSEELTQRIVIPISFEEARFVSPSTVAPKKKPGEFRKTLDLRFVNALQLDIHFRMEGPETVQQLMKRGDWMTKLDIKSAFNHLVVQSWMVPYLAFAFQGQCYTYRAMPFGSKHSPRLFTQALGYGIRFVRQHWNVRIVVFMDDLLLMHEDRQYLQIATLQICVYLQYLGWTIATGKCVFTPERTMEYLG